MGSLNVCDRCGVVIKDGSFRGAFTFDFRIDKWVSVDLCAECRKDVWAWLKKSKRSKK